MPLRRAALLALSLATPAAADTPEPGSAEAIARFTTDPRFLNAVDRIGPGVGHRPLALRLPRPRRRRGRGADAQRADPGLLPRPRRGVAARARGDDRPHRGRPGHPARRDRRRGRHPRPRAPQGRHRGPGRSAADRPRPGGGRDRRRAPFYYFNGALHADETGSAEMLMELAYRLAVSDEPRIRRIRENVVVLINPVAEPDGRDKMADWFYRYLKGRTDYGAPAAPVAALLGPLRVRGHQPRRAPARIRGHARRARDVLRLPPAGHPRPARGHPAAADLERHRPLQPEPRPHRDLSAFLEHEPARSDDADRARACPGCGRGTSARVSATTTWIRSR